MVIKIGQFSKLIIQQRRFRLFSFILLIKVTFFRIHQEEGEVLWQRKRKRWGKAMHLYIENRVFVVVTFTSV